MTSIPQPQHPRHIPGQPARRYFRIALPPGMTLINANSRIHNKQRAQHTAALRDAATLTCRTDKAMNQAINAARPEPVFEHAWIFGVLHPASNRRVDPANWYGSFKAAVDGIVRAGVLADDDDRHVIGPDMRRGPVVKGGQIALHIYETFASDWCEERTA